MECRPFTCSYVPMPGKVEGQWLAFTSEPLECSLTLALSTAWANPSTQIVRVRRSSWPQSYRDCCFLNIYMYLWLIDCLLPYSRVRATRDLKCQIRLCGSPTSKTNHPIISWQGSDLPDCNNHMYRGTTENR